MRKGLRMPGLVEGKVALVTGAGSGIGRSAALAFAREGAAVAVSDIDPDAGAATAELVEKAGGTAAAFPCDVSDEAAVARLVDDVVARFGGLHCAHNNAGLGHGQARLADIERAGWDRTLAVNLTGTWLCMKFEIRHMAASGGGAIVATSSATSVLGYALSGGYAATKAGINALVRTAANEYAAEGVRVNAVLPGPIRTDMVARAIRANPGLEAHLKDTVPMGRVGAPEDVAEAVVWLCSDRAPYTTGAMLAIDGGQVLR
jgi:NAD(P)-dependent dehydrogenase (short-subunit alcohol dehydrogenase family)